MIGSRLAVAIVLLLALTSLPTVAQEDTRDIGITRIEFLPQGDGSVAVDAHVSILQLGQYAFRLKFDVYRGGQFVRTIRDSNLATEATGCPGVSACPSGAECNGTCIIGNIFIGYHGYCANGGCCTPGGAGDCRYFCACLQSDIDFLGLDTLQTGDQIMVTITPAPGTVDYNPLNNSMTAEYQ